MPEKVKILNKTVNRCRDTHEKNRIARVRFRRAFVCDLSELYGFILEKDRYLRALAFAALQID